MNDLMWEVTVCNSIEPNTSPVRQILAQNRTYGEQLAAIRKNTGQRAEVIRPLSVVLC